ncbi:hypothetical protein [Umboniibacter marinipuniceus]|uniref:Uncharacterized protein n=1 Tax=Umboniibacter marinipuniceus TaxID=569599 RepID=A0A3M0AJC1_9GAMM|nr:hypothetical protein [Umboniibacter marinipuniceus]RMA82665.1 hypothetical protein DFR27_0617 [Umboniibacter marinipuniceus]
MIRGWKFGESWEPIDHPTEYNDVTDVSAESLLPNRHMYSRELS